MSDLCTRRGSARDRRRTTILCFEAHAADGRVWAIRHRGQWSRHRQVTTFAAGTTVYLGPQARQPKAYVQFTDVVLQVYGDGAVLTNQRW